MEKIDYKKQLKHLYGPSAKNVEIVDVPQMNFLMVDGKGDPNTAKSFTDAIEALYPLAYTLKFMVKKGKKGVDYGVLPLEALWWTEDDGRFSPDSKSAWKWTSMIMQPDVVTPDRFHFTITSTDTPAFGIIAIGQEVWQQINGTWQAQPLPEGIPYQPIPICEAMLPELDLSKVEPQPETLDGLESLHYVFPKNASPKGLAGVFGENSDMAVLIKAIDVDLWLSSDGANLVRLELSGKGLYSDGRPLMVHLELDVRDINDKDIKVEPPPT